MATILADNGLTLEMAHEQTAYINSAINRDYTLVLGLVVFYSALVIVFNTIVDIALASLNPRLRVGGS